MLWDVGLGIGRFCGRVGGGLGVWWSGSGRWDGGTSVVGGPVVGGRVVIYIYIDLFVYIYI